MILTSRRMLRRAAATIITAAGLTLGALSITPQSAQAAEPANLQSVRNTLLAQHNAVRAEKGLPALAQDSTLSRYAQNWSSTMASSGNFEHSDLSDLRALDPSRFTNALAENIAAGQKPEEVTQAWRESPGHYKNMMSTQVDAVGFGYVLSADGTPYYTTVFAYTGGTANRAGEAQAPASQEETQLPAADAATQAEQEQAPVEIPAETSVTQPIAEAEHQEPAAAEAEAPATADAQEQLAGNEEPAPSSAPADSARQNNDGREANVPAPSSLATTGANPVGIAAGSAGLLAALAGAAALMWRRKQNS